MVKISVRWSLGSLALLGLMTGGAIRARAQFSHRVKARVPFAFEVAGKVLPAGAYTITHPLDGAIQIASQDGAQVVYATAHRGRSGTPFEAATLVFHRIDGRYFFTGVWEPESQMGMQVWTSRAEREAQSAFTANRPPKGPSLPAPEPVYVSARLAP